VHPEAATSITRVLHFLPGTKFFPVAEIKGRDVIPDHFLAMCSIAKATPALPLPYEAALDYLERKIPDLETSLPNGWYVATFDGSPLGWMKKISGGWKNHYPMEWRLRKRS
jgi:NOL1/NOP2/fmu family ribosome biogenesis protein